ITLVIVVVFLPIAMSTGLVANILAQFCVTVIISTMLSLLVSFTLVPWLYSRFGKLEHINKYSFFGKIIHGFESGLDAFTHKISDILRWSLRSRLNKFLTLLVSVLLFAGSISLAVMGYIGSDFFPSSDRGEFMLQFELEKDATLERTNALVRQAEDILANKAEIKKTITTVGQSSDGGMSAATGSRYKAEIHVIMTDEAKKVTDSKVFAVKLRNELLPILIGSKIVSVPMGIMGPEQAPLKLTIIGSSIEDAQEFALQAADLLRQVPGSRDVKLTSESGNPEISVQVDREKMTSLGLNVASVGMTMQTAFSGNTDNKFRA